jgi:lactoylglutathione lyase
VGGYAQRGLEESVHPPRSIGASGRPPLGLTVRARVARIEHIALWTEDIDRLARFYAEYFGAAVGLKYANPSKGFESRFLTFQSGTRMELMKTLVLRPLKYGPGIHRMGLTHLAFSLGSENRVDELTATLREAGFAVEDGPRRTGDGYYESVILDPDGNRLELTV